MATRQVLTYFKFRFLKRPLQDSIARLEAIEQRADELATLADEAATESQQRADQNKAAELEAKARLTRVLEDEKATEKRVAALRQTVAELEGQQERIEAILRSGVLPEMPELQEVRIKTSASPFSKGESRQVLFAEDAREWKKELLIAAAYSQDQVQQQKAKELEAKERALEEQEKALQQQKRKQEADLQQRETDLRSKEQNFTRRQQQARPDLEETEAATRRIAEAVSRGMEALVQGLRGAGLLPADAASRLESQGFGLMRGKDVDTQHVVSIADRLTAFGIAIRDELPSAVEHDKQRIKRAVTEIKPKGTDLGDDWF